MLVPFCIGSDNLRRQNMTKVGWRLTSDGNTIEAHPPRALLLLPSDVMRFIGLITLAAMLVLPLPGRASEWSRTIGGTGPDFAVNAVPTLDGGYVVAGGTTSFSSGQLDAWILKFDTDGNVIWQKSY